MNNSNPVFQVLIPYGNQNVLPAGQPIDALSPGQIGVFDYNTKLSIDGASFVDKFFIAVGYDNNGDGVIDYIRKSSGQFIKTKNIYSYLYKQYNSGQPMVIEIDNIKASCNADYSLKITFRNDMIYDTAGYNLFTKTYSVKTPCCDGCDNCYSADCNVLVKLLVEAINIDPDGLVYAEAIDPSTNTPVANIDNFIATNSAVNTDNDPTNDVCLKLRLTANPLKIREYCNYPAEVWYPLETYITATLLDGLECVAEATVVQYPVYEQGSGHMVRYREYIAGGWNGLPGPYRLGYELGMIGRPFDYKSDINTKYDFIGLEYSNEYMSGWQHYSHNLATEIYIPTNDSATINTLKAVLNNLLNPLGFPNQ